MEKGNDDIRNQIECRRLEMRLAVAGVSQDWDLFWRSMQDIGNSGRFDAERLHENFAVAGGMIREMLSKGTP